jgi:hypothetical protein
VKWKKPKSERDRIAHEAGELNAACDALKPKPLRIRKMKKHWYVIEADDNTTWHGREKDDCPERFNSFDAAETRAIRAAKAEPGKEIKIVGVEAIVVAHVEDPKTIIVTGAGSR